MNRPSFFEPPWWKFGGRLDFWIKNIKMVENMISEHKLEAVHAESLVNEAPFAPVISMAREQEKSLRILKTQFPGGIRIPHLHFKGDVFLLNDKQWKEFSARMIKDFQAKLSKVNAVSFDQAMELSEAVNPLLES